MENPYNKWALVTGASSGFGVQFAKLIAERKANLVLVARRTEPMETLAEELRQRHSVQVCSRRHGPVAGRSPRKPRSLAAAAPQAGDFRGSNDMSGSDYGPSCCEVSKGAIKDQIRGDC